MRIYVQMSPPKITSSIHVRSSTRAVTSKSERNVMKPVLKNILFIVALQNTYIGAVESAYSASMKIIYRFNGGGTNGIGIEDFMDLTEGSGGALYGTTIQGGSSNCDSTYFSGCGTIFKLSPTNQAHTTWSEKTLYLFKGAHDGGNPEIGVLISKEGEIYGNTSDGSSPSDPTVFKISPPTINGGAWKKTIISRTAYKYYGSTWPSGITMDKNSAIYGAVFTDSTNEAGTIYKLTPPTGIKTAWTKKIIFQFKDATSTGSHPFGNFLIDHTDAIVGETNSGRFSGSPYNCGYIYRLLPPIDATSTRKIEIIGGNEANCFLKGSVSGYGLIEDQKGNLYGIARGYVSEDGTYGRVFMLSPPTTPGDKWKFTTLSKFHGGTDGANPSGKLTMDSTGALFGVTQFGGFQCATNAPDGCGTIYKLTPPINGSTTWKKTILYRFKNQGDGMLPNGKLLLHTDGSFYGIAGWSLVYRYTP